MRRRQGSREAVRARYADRRRGWPSEAAECPLTASTSPPMSDEVQHDTMSWIIMSKTTPMSALRKVNGPAGFQ
jgi:hypothetical protein